jgi:hypothetical protein
MSAKERKQTSAAGRQDGDYTPPVLAEPKGGPIPSPAKDATRAHIDLKDYWLHGEGAGKWSTWTELYHHLVKYLPPERAKRTAAEWFHQRYGYWPGADLNKVAHGKPPRGSKVGPG